MIRPRKVAGEDLAALMIDYGGVLNATVISFPTHLFKIGNSFLNSGYPEITKPKLFSSQVEWSINKLAFIRSIQDLQEQIQELHEQNQEVRHFAFVSKV